MLLYLFYEVFFCSVLPLKNQGPQCVWSPGHQRQSDSKQTEGSFFIKPQTGSKFIEGSNKTFYTNIARVKHARQDSNCC